MSHHATGERVVAPLVGARENSPRITSPGNLEKLPRWTLAPLSEGHCDHDKLSVHVVLLSLLTG